MPAEAAGLVVAIERRRGFVRAAARGRSARKEFSRACRCALCTSITVCRPPPPIFAQLARDLCAELSVPLRIVAVEVSREARRVDRGGGARRALRGARAELQPRECLLTAHHREDQAETLLLQALRGAGVKGMSAMPVCRPLGRGWHVRPLLERGAQPTCCKFGELEPAASIDPMNQDLQLRPRLSARHGLAADRRSAGLAQR